MTAEVHVQAPAKVNLTLGVGPVRPDGYHPLATVYQAIGLYDEVVVRTADRTSLTLSSDGVDVSEVPTDSTNLAWRAVTALGAHVGTELTAAIHIHKRIPVAGGLAGGSTDAAATLVAVEALLGLGLPRAALLEVAATLGSDVPFCVLGGTAVGSGRGEVVAPVMTRGVYWWAVCPGTGGLSTPAVYRAFDRLHDGGAVGDPEVPDALLTGLLAGDPARVGAALRNDLEEPALMLRPDLGQALRAGLEDGGALGGLVSGSGPTTVFLCSDADHAREVCDTVRAATGGPPGLVAPGPAHGARQMGGGRAGGSS